MTLPDEKINEITDQLDCGFNCYVHKKNGETLFTPNEEKHPDMELDCWNKEYKKLKNHYSDYYFIEPPESHEAFKTMVNFIETLDESNPLKDKLYDSLDRPRPFRRFQDALYDAGEYRQMWFDFKKSELAKYVKLSIRDAKFFEQEGIEYDE